MKTTATILVVDDTEAQRYTTSYVLRNAGFEVIEASTGQGALAMAEQQPDLILLDILLPDLDGIEVCRRLKATPATSAIPIIHVSAHRVDAEHRVQSLNCGADDYITQPALPEELAAKVKAWSRVRRAESELRRKNTELEQANAKLQAQLHSLQSAEEALAESHQRTQRVLSSITEGFYCLDIEGNFVEANQLAERHFRRSRSELLGRNMWQMLPAQNNYRARFQEAGASGQPIAFEAESHINPGRWSELHVYPTKTGLEVYFRDITERKRTELALAQSEARLRRFYESGVVGVFHWKADGAITEANDSFLDITGYSRQDLSAGVLNWARMTPPEYRELDHFYISEVKTTGIHHAREMEYIRKDGVRVPVMVGAASVDEAANEGLAFVLDITERKRAEEALRQSEQRFRALVSATSEVVFCVSPDWSEMRRLRGRGVVSSASMPTTEWIQQYIYADDQDKVRAAVSRAVQTKTVLELEHRVRRADGSVGWALSRAVPLYDSTGEITGWFGAASDISTRKHAEQSLRRSEARFRATVENIPQAVWVADSLANFQYLSPKWLEYTGTTEEENANGGWAKAIHPEDRVKASELWQIAVATHGTYEAEYRLRRRDGEYRWHVARAVPLAQSEGEEPLWFGTTTDIEDRKRTQELLIRSEKVAALGRMAATLAHDINNPLAAAMNALYIAQAESPPDTLKHFIDLADSELRRISHITRQALGFYRESAQPGIVDIEATLDEAVSLFQSKINAKHIRVETQHNSNWKVTGVGGELRQVFSNLIANSLDAVGEHGAIKIRASHLRDLKSGTPYVRVTVSDNGTGIEADAIPHLFEPLFTTKGSIGTGLGLWVSKQLVDKHGGSVRVRSCTRGARRGTSFSVLLPAHAPAQPQPMAIVS